MDERRGVLILAGVTASGKTNLAIALARRFDAEIVGADSRQIYRGMAIGTGAPSQDQLLSVRHHLVGFLDPHERYSAARFAHDAVSVIRSVHARGRRAIVVGGTGFYLRALTGEVSLAPQHDETLRERLASEARLHPAPVLWEWLRARDARRASAVDPNDAYRIVRALEIALAPQDRGVDRFSGISLGSANISYLKVALDVPLETVDERIERRADSMLANGLIEEAERIGPHATAATAVGYTQALAYASGWSTREELRASLVRATRRYARRQRSWLRSEAAVTWLKPGDVTKAVKEKLGWP
jgi:tRNA dimethylallyltransferase